MEAFLLYLILVNYLSVHSRTGWEMPAFVLGLILLVYLAYSWHVKRERDEYRRTLLKEIQKLNAGISSISSLIRADQNGEADEKIFLDEIAGNALTKINDGSYSLDGIALSLDITRGDVVRACDRLYAGRFIDAQAYERITGIKPSK